MTNSLLLKMAHLCNVKIYLLKNVIFQFAMLVYQRVFYSPFIHQFIG